MYADDALVIATPPEGLAPVEMRRLGRVVCLFGRNGAGKSRLLRAAYGEAAATSGNDLHFQLKFALHPAAEVVDPHRRSALDLENAFRNTATRYGFGTYEMHWWLVLQYLAWKQHEASHPGAPLSDEERTTWAATWNAAKDLVAALAGMTLDVRFIPGSSRPEIVLDGNPVRPDLYSEGQRILLANAVFLLRRVDSLDGVHLFVDEPEMHLHPSAVSELIARLRFAVGRSGRLWIATHAISTLGDLDPSEVWLVKDSQVFSPGADLVDNAFAALVGGDERVERLRQALERPREWAAIRFAVECFQAPEPVSARRNDPQLEQIITAMDEAEGGRRLKILDYGAGAGRLAAHLASDPKMARRSSYWALEPYGDHGELQLNLSALKAVDAEATSASCAAREIAELVQAATRFDLIVLCNVVHEIAPVQWPALFASLQSVLDATGSLLIVEDQEIPRGERAHRYGFVVLDQDGIAALLGLTPADLRIQEARAPFARRLLAAAVSNAQLGKYDVKAALRAVIKNTKARARALLAEGRDDARSGRRLGFLAQNLTNASIALDDLSAEMT